MLEVASAFLHTRVLWFLIPVQPFSLPFQCLGQFDKGNTEAASSKSVMICATISAQVFLGREPTFQNQEDPKSGAHCHKITPGPKYITSLISGNFPSTALHTYSYPLLLQNQRHKQTHKQATGQFPNEPNL